DPAPRAQGVDVALAHRTGHLDRYAKSRLRQIADAAFGLGGAATRPQPVCVSACQPQRGTGTLQATKCALRRGAEQASEIERAARLGPGPGQAGTAERLHADHRADHIAIDVDVAGVDAIDHARDRLVNARVEAEGQAVARPVDVVD